MSEHDYNEQYLKRTIGAARDFVESQEQPVETDDTLNYMTGRQSLDMPLVEIPELVNNWVRIGDLSLLVGSGGVGKSTIAMNLALSLAAGQPFMGYPVDKAERVLYLDLEMGLYEFRSRLNMLLGQYPAAADNIYWVCLSNFTMRNERNMQLLKNTISAIRPKLLLVDNHASFHGGDPNRENEMMVNVITPFRDIMAEFILGVLYLMHTPWNEKDRPRGTMAIFDAAGTVVAVTRPQADTRELKWTKRRSVRSDMGATEVEISYNAETHMVYASAGMVVDEVLDSIEFPARRSFVVKRLAEALGISDRWARNKVKEMEEGGLLINKGEGMVVKGHHRLTDYVK